jgi:hypothetical protein
MSKPLLDAINAGTAHIVTMTAAEAYSFVGNFSTDDDEYEEKAEELDSAFDDAQGEAKSKQTKTFVIIEIGG